MPTGDTEKVRGNLSRLLIGVETLGTLLVSFGDITVVASSRSNHLPYLDADETPGQNHCECYVFKRIHISYFKLQFLRI